MITLYYWPNSAIVMRALWAVEELDVPFQKVRLWQEKNEHKTPEFLAINPNAKMPALVDGDVKVWESLAVLVYLGEKYGVERGLWPKQGGQDWATAMSWVAWGTSDFHESTFAFARHAADVHFSLPKEKQVPSIAEQAKTESHRCLAMLDKQLSDREYILGSNFSIVDLSLCTICFRSKLIGLDLSPYEHLNAWIGRCGSRPKFKKVMSENTTAARGGAHEKEADGWADAGRIPPAQGS